MSEFSRFLVRAHRRIFWRSVEHAAIGLLIGCSVALILSIVAWWRQVEAIGPVIAILFISSIAGIVASIWRRPTLIDTAGVIEMQLNAPELLSSAMLAGNHADRSFVEALIALADARVAGVTPSSLVLRRFGSRTWSGVGLATASVVVIALMTSAPINNHEAIAKSPDSVDAWLTRRADAPNQTENQTGERSQREPISSHSTIDTGAEISSTSSDSSKSVARSRDGMNSSSASSHGTGSAHSNSKDSPVLPRDSGSPRAGTNSGTLVAGGSGAAANTGTLGAINPGGVSASGGIRIAPWNLPRWTDDRAAALDAVRAGAIPDSYRSLVQDYFDRP